MEDFQHVLRVLQGIRFSNKDTEPRPNIPWPSGNDKEGVVSRLRQWLNDLAQNPFRSGPWWGYLEHHALTALANNPGMDFGLFPTSDDLLKLDVFTCGAAKSTIYRPDNKESNPHQLKMVKEILEGRSLELHQTGIDPIRTIMAAAHGLKSKFGGQINHFIFQARKLDASIIMAAQTWTERLTQRVLSVKTLDEQLPDFTEYLTMASRWLEIGQHSKGEHSDGQKNELVNEEVASDNANIIKLIAEVGEEVKDALDRGFEINGSEKPPPLPSWQKWLEHPYKLPILLSEENELLLPLDDLRVQPFISKILTEDQQQKVPIKAPNPLAHRRRIRIRPDVFSVKSSDQPRFLRWRVIRVTRR